MIYFDNAATSYPKPEGVLAAVGYALTELNANPGRSAYESAINASLAVLNARQELADFVGLSDFRRMIFTGSTTEGLNIALLGLLKKGDHVIISPLEHNSVWRPIGALTKQGVSYDIAPFDPVLGVKVSDVAALIKPNTKMLIFMHASNVTGHILPVAELGGLARERNILILVDAAQSLGMVPVNMEKMNIDLLAFPGHKGLYGPMGSGGLAVGKRAEEIQPTFVGGTGSKSKAQEQPTSFPDRLECGTLPLPAIWGMLAGLRDLKERGVEYGAKRAYELCKNFLERASKIPGVTCYGPPVDFYRTPIVTLNIENYPPGELTSYLEEEYGIAVRSGFHCSPLAHCAIGTEELGAVRFSFSCFNTEKEIDIAIEALERASRKGGLL